MTSNDDVDALTASAESGDVNAMLRLARQYSILCASSDDNDGCKALEWFERAAPLATVDAANSRVSGVDVNEVDTNGWALCHDVAYFGVGELVRRVLDAGGKVDATATNANTPLHFAAWNGHEQVVEMLLGAGANVNVVNCGGRTPLHGAVAWGRVNIVQILLAAGANVKAVDNRGRTPLHIAADAVFADAEEQTPRRGAIMKSLITAGSDVNARDEDQRTPLHLVAASGNHKAVEVLVIAGADVSAVDKDGITARELAATERNLAILYILDTAAKYDAMVGPFDDTRAALDAARAARNRLSSLDVVAPLVAESTSGDGVFGAVAATRARDVEFADAERALVAHQDILRAAEQIDAQVVAARDAARQQLVRVAASILESYDSAPLGAFTTLGNRVTAAKAALVQVGAASDGAADVVTFDDWLAGAHTSAAPKRASTESGADSLATTVQSWCAGAKDVQSRSVATAMVRARFATDDEKRELDELRIPRIAYDELVTKLDELHAQITQALRLVDRAHEVRVVEAPSCDRLRAALAGTAKVEKQIKYARADLDHPDDAESEAAAKAQLLELKAELVEKQRESTAAVVELAAHVFDFPELRLLFPKARLDDLFMAGGDASALRTLSQYEDRVAIAVTRHKVERASFGGVECALKLFQLLPANQRAFVKEARRLRQLAHPNIVEVRAVFVDGATGVIEMPLYAHGDLWQWLAAAPRNVHDKLRVLRATLCGLEHVHRMGVVHADVKPENVFVDSDGVAKLGDFDVSKDDATRVTVAATVVGFSLAYAAPEIKNGSTASKAGDMYAFGMTLFDIVHGAKPIKARPINVELLARDEPIEDGTSLRGLTRRLVDESAEKRVSASDALKSPLFAPPAPGRDPQLHQRECSVCCESRWLDEGVECEAQHFVCSADLEGVANAFCATPLSALTKRGGALRCNERGCMSPPWSNANLARALSAARFAAYVDKLREMSENRVLVEQRQLREAELAQLERRLRGEMARDEEVAAHRRVIRDDLLCLRCPRCKTAFIVDDFNRCLAMTCANCNAGFCAWCLKDCGNDAHWHVNNCELNPMQPRTVFSNAAEFEKAHRKRYADVVGEYLRTAVRNDEIRAAVRAAIQHDLDDLGVELTM